MRKHQLKHITTLLLLLLFVEVLSYAQKPSSSLQDTSFSHYKIRYYESTRDFDPLYIQHLLDLSIPLNRENQEKGFQFVSPAYNSFSETERILKKHHSPDAKIISYYRDTIKNKYYRIEVASNNNNLSSAFYEELYKLNEPINQENLGGKNYYVLGKFKTYREARVYSRNLRQIPEMYVVKYEKNQRERIIPKTSMPNEIIRINFYNLRLPSIEKSAELIAKKNKNNYDSLIRLADSLSENGKLKQAERAYWKAYEIMPNEEYAYLQVKHLNRLIEYQNKPFYEKLQYNKSIRLIRFLLLSILYFILSLIVLSLVIMIRRNLMMMYQKRIEKLKEDYRNLIVNYMFDEEIEQEMFLKLNKIATNDFTRKILIDEIIEITGNLSGDSAEKIIDLYYKLDLHEDSIRKAYSNKWYVKVKGFREMAFLNIGKANHELIRSLNSKNDILSLESQLALVRLSDESPYDFLYYLDREFSLWEQVNVYNSIIQHKLEIPPFKFWLNSENSTIIIFCLKMIARFKQLDAQPKVIRMVNHENEEIRKFVYLALGELEIAVAKSCETMQDRFNKEEKLNQLAILRSLGNLTHSDTIPFLFEVLDQEDDVEIQIQAAKSIKQMGEVGVQKLEELVNSEEFYNYKFIIKHVIDDRI